MANRTAQVAAANDEARIERALADKIRAAKDSAGRRAEIERAKKGVSEGMLPSSAVDRLEALASALDAKEGDKAGKAKREAVTA
jgi:hypothetical protein